MKIILSRKGFDSSNGGQANPILPDGTLLSLPIPDEYGNNTFSSLHWKGRSYYDIIHSLKPRTKLKPDDFCHLDPDLRSNVKDRPSGWKPAFGQADGALTHLRNYNVSEGDLFLFFGWFKETEVVNGKLVYKRKAKDKHIIYAYMQIGEIITRKVDAYSWLKDHPHIGDRKEREDEHNAVYLPTDKLSFLPDHDGCDVLTYHQNRVLTKEGMTRRYWDLPPFFKNVTISHNPNPWVNDVFLSAMIGQEFVMESTPEILEWVKQIIQ